MKIGIDIRTLMDTRYSGVSEYAFNLVREILKLDHDNEYRLFYNCFGDCPNMPRFSGDKVKVIKFNYPNKIFNYLLVKIFNYPKIDKELGVDAWFMPHINFIGLAGSARSIITIHDLSFLRYPEFFSARKNFWHRLVNVKKLLKKFAVIVAVSENTKRDIIELCGVSEAKIKIIYPGLSAQFFDRELINGQAEAVRIKYDLPDKYILYLGTVEPRKNVEGIIRAYNEMRNKHHELSGVKLIIAGGKGWKSDNIYNERERSQFKSGSQFFGHVADEDRACLYGLAKVFVYPSFYEGFGFPPLEAMAAGVPVVASFAASLPEVVGGAALMVDPYNINEIARALKETLTDENLRNKLINRGWERVKKFNWENTARQYLEILTK